MLLALLKLIFTKTFQVLSSQNCRKNMKGNRKKKAKEFKSGHLPHNKGIKMESKEDSVKQNIVYIRPTQTEISMVQNNPIVGEAMSALDLSAGSGEIYKTLRPSPPSPLEVEKKNSGSEESRLVLLALIYVPV